MPQPDPDVGLGKRLWRLVGEKGDSSAERGGGVEVVTLFRTLLESAIDNSGKVDFSCVLGEVRERYAYKGNRLRTLYKGVDADPDRGFVLDGLAQLVHIGLLAESAGDVWTLAGPADDLFARPITVIPGEGRAAVEVDALAPLHLREMADQMSQFHYALSGLRDEAAKLGFLNREIDPDQVKALAESMRRHGEFWKWRPLRYDQHGRLLDGHHRYAAAIEAGLDPDKLPADCSDVENDLDAAWIAFDANIHRGWSEGELAAWQSATAILGKRGDQRDATVQLTEFYLRHGRDASGKPLSNVEIARRVNVSNMTVGRIRAELAERNPTDLTVLKLSDSERAEEALRVNPRRTNKTIAAEVGCRGHTVQRVRKQLVDTGSIPSVSLIEQRLAEQHEDHPVVAPEPEAPLPASEPEPATEERAPTAAGPQRPKRGRREELRQKNRRVELEPARIDDFSYLHHQLETARQRFSEIQPADQWYTDQIITHLLKAPITSADRQKIAASVAEAMR